MKFDDMIKILMTGVAMRRADWFPDYYITVDQNGVTVDEDNIPYSFTKHDYMSNWEQYVSPTEDSEAGTLLSYVTLDGNKKLCMLVEDGDDNSYTIVDMSDWSVYAKHIRKEDLDIFLDAYNLKRENKVEDDSDVEWQRKFLVDALVKRQKESMEAE